MSWQDFIRNVHMKDTLSVSPAILEVLTTIKHTPTTGTSVNSAGLGQKPQPKSTATMDKIFVICGTRAEFEEYRRRKHEEMDVNLTDFVHVNSPMQLKGYSNPHGVLYGSWNRLPELRNILTEIMLQSHTPNKTIQNILDGL